MGGTDVTRGRRLVLVDLENLLGCAPAVAADACWELALTRLLDAAGVDAARDHVVIGVGPEWVFTAARLAPGARLVTRAGESGADLALCDCVEDVDLVAARYAGVVVASGDHAFVRPVLRLLGAGVPTTVAAMPVQASPALTYHASDIVWLERPAATLGEGAYVGVADGARRLALAA